MMQLRSLTLASALLCLCSSALAHDYWLEAKPQFADAPQTVEIDIRVGEELKGSYLPNIPSWNERFEVFDGQQRTNVQGEMGRDPAGFISPQQNGGYLIGMLTENDEVTLKAKKFHRYLRDEGLEKIIQLRQQQGKAKTKGRELYKRCAKNLVQIGTDSSNQAWDHRFGYPLELMPLQNPAAVAPGDTLEFQLLYEGQPLAQALLIARNAATPETAFQIRTDSNGKAQIPITKNGFWMIKATEMVALKNNREFDWQSYWASFAFGVQ